VAGVSKLLDVQAQVLHQRRVVSPVLPDMYNRLAHGVHAHRHGLPVVEGLGVGRTILPEFAEVLYGVPVAEAMSIRDFGAESSLKGVLLLFWGFSDVHVLVWMDA